MAAVNRPRVLIGSDAPTDLVGAVPASPWDARLQRAVIIFGRLMLGLL